MLRRRSQQQLWYFKVQHLSLIIQYKLFFYYSQTLSVLDQWNYCLWLQADEYYLFSWWMSCLCISSYISNKPNPNQLSNNVKPALVNGAAGTVGTVGTAGTAVPGPPGSVPTPGLGRACESCYSKSFCCVLLLRKCSSYCYLCPDVRVLSPP